MEIGGRKMPFITKDRRIIIEEDFKKLDKLQPGDRCYFFYKMMVDEWRANPCWTTAHNIYKDMIHGIAGEKDIDMRAEDDEDDIAYQLAWQVFFQWYVVPYEKEKEKLNGKI